jgi:hypothetical protein
MRIQPRMSYEEYLAECDREEARIEWALYQQRLRDLRATRRTIRVETAMRLLRYCVYLAIIVGAAFYIFGWIRAGINALTGGGDL